MNSFHRFSLGLLLVSLVTMFGCGELMVRETTLRELLSSRFPLKEIVGFVAGFGTTFAAIPDLVAMLKRRSSQGMNPRMAAIMGLFQMVWIYYGLLIASRPVVSWNMIAVAVNFFTVIAYLHFSRRERNRRRGLSPSDPVIKS